ncbi:hypothetical protein [Paraburkholderia bannensis]|uniref:hypothetical protein n=1 Tax=Paraburkholderia bannensis TaxID=765414 RepID=UPI002AC36596|nr:hypothetical protein [Paraburkholderia bannensis]
MKIEFKKGLYTIVAASYEAHHKQFRDLISSIERYCVDAEKLQIVVVLEQANVDLFRDAIERSKVRVSVVTTEEVLRQFGLSDSPVRFLQTAGKFTFQSIKKIGGLLAARSEWSVVLDSETIFIKSFRIEEIVKKYSERKYIFYSRTTRRGGGWEGGEVDRVTRQCERLLGASAGDRGYMELNTWFYETSKVVELFSVLSTNLNDFLRNPSPQNSIFENVLYYIFLANNYSHEYCFLEFEAEWKKLVPAEISGRYDLGKPLLSFLGADHVTYTFRAEDVAAVSGFFEKFDLPFLRVEPLYMDGQQAAAYENLPNVVAFTSSAHLLWLKKKIAICVSGDYARHSDSRFIGPLGWVKSLVGFLTGCECDIFIHGWRNSDEAAILNALNPAAFSFEDKPIEILSAIASNVRGESRYFQPGDVIDGLSNLHSMQKCIELVEGSGRSYDFVLKLSPDLHLESSLYDLLRGITLEGDVNDDAIYIPRQYQGEGVNRHIALGSWKAMQIYMHSYGDVLRRGGGDYLGESAAVLRNMVSSDLEIIPVDVSYADMRGEDYYGWDSVAKRFSDQSPGGNWRCAAEIFPKLQSAKIFFRDKLKSLEFLCGKGKEISDIFLRTTSAVSNHSSNVSLLSWRDGNPNGSFTMVAVGDRSSGPMVYPTGQQVMLSSETAELVPNNCENRYVFFYKNEAADFVLVEWTIRGGVFSRSSVAIGPDAVSAAYWN